MDGTQVLTLDRRELYDLVWSIPLSRLCKRYCISDVALAKICKRHHIPYPLRGYWARVRNGQKVPIPPLEPVDDPQLQRVRISTRTVRASDSPTCQESLEAQPDDRRKEERIKVPDQLADPHPVVERTLRSLNSARPGPNGRVRPRAARCLDVEVSPESADRAARILDALVKALEARGYPVAADEGDPPAVRVSVLGEKVSLHLEEKLQKQERPREPNENRGPYQSLFDTRSRSEPPVEYDYVLTGRLALRIDGTLGYGYRQTWSDGQRPLDGMLNAIVNGIVTAAQASAAIRAENQRREREKQESERRRQEEELQRRQEEARRTDFDHKLGAWEQAERIRRFAAAARDRAAREGRDLNPGGELDRWLTWALRRADRLDPFTARRPERRWPPPTGHKVKTEARGPYSWSSSYSADTAVVPPEPEVPPATPAAIGSEGG